MPPEMTDEEITKEGVELSFQNGGRIIVDSNCDGCVRYRIWYPGADKPRWSRRKSQWFIKAVRKELHA